MQYSEYEKLGIINYDKLINITYKEIDFDEEDKDKFPNETFYNFKDFQKSILEQYKYNDYILRPHSFNITFGSKVHPNAPKLKIDLRYIKFIDLEVEDFTATTLLTYLSENWNDFIGYDEIIKTKEYNSKSGIQYEENEESLKNVCIYDML